MRCTDCGKEIKPIVAIDIDGTLGDYHGSFIGFLEQYFQMMAPEAYEYDGKDSFKLYLRDVFNIDEHAWKEAKLAYRQGGGKRSMSAFPGGSELCRAVQQSGGELWITTTRPYMRLDNVDPDTRWWLNYHGIKYDALLYDDSKYDRLAYNADPARVVAVLEDEPIQIQEARRLFGATIPMIRRTNFNRGFDPFAHGYEDLDAARHEIVKRIKEWKENNE